MLTVLRESVNVTIIYRDRSTAVEEFNNVIYRTSDDAIILDSEDRMTTDYIMKADVRRCNVVRLIAE